MPGQYFAHGWPRPAYILDAEALVVSASPRGKDAPFGELATACGGSVIAEHRYKEVVLTDVATYQELERLAFKRRTIQILCSPDWVLAVGGPKDDRRVYNIRTLETLTGSLSKPARASLSGDRLFFAAEADDTFAAGVRMLDLDTGAQTLIHQGRPAVPGRSHRVRGIEVSPDGTRVAITVVSGDDANKVSEVFVYSPAGELLASSVVANNGGRSYWLDDTKLLFRSNSASSQVLAPSDLSIITDLGPNLTWVRYLEGDRLLGMRGASVLAIPVTGGQVEVLNSLPAALQLVRLAEPVVMTTVGSATDAQIATPISSPVLEALESDETSPPDDNGEAEPLALVGEQAEASSAVAVGQTATDKTSWPGWLLGIGPVLLVIGALSLPGRRIRHRS